MSNNKFSYTQAEEVKHYMFGLAYIHCSSRGVVWKINMAYDVLFNEVNDNNEHLFQCMICY